MSRATYPCCKPVFWKHEDGWDVYPRSECMQLADGSWVPKWFDSPIVEDARTRKEASAEIADFHVLGICLVEGYA